MSGLAIGFFRSGFVRFIIPMIFSVVVHIALLLAFPVFFSTSSAPLVPKEKVIFFSSIKRLTDDESIDSSYNRDLIKRVSFPKHVRRVRKKVVIRRKVKEVDVSFPADGLRESFSSSEVDGGDDKEVEEKNKGFDSLPEIPKLHGEELKKELPRTHAEVDRSVDYVSVARKIQAEVRKNTVYPPLARRNSIEGIVEVSFYVGRNGIPYAVSVYRSSGYKVLDNAALKAVMRCRNLPFLNKKVVVPVRFILTD